MKEQIFNYLSQQKDPVTFDQLMTAFPDYGGIKSLGTSHSNLIFWVGMCEDMTLAIMSLLEDKVIEITPCSADAYLKAGNYPDYPLANSYRPYETFHWLPVVLSAVNVYEVKH